MNSPYENFGIGAEWESLHWAPSETDIFSDAFGTVLGNTSLNTHDDAEDLYYLNPASSHLHSELGLSSPTRAHDVQDFNAPCHHAVGDGVQCFTDRDLNPGYFGALTARTEPPNIHGLQRQWPRFEGDLYTALWVRGEGTDRAGWCGFCSSWHKLKDSAFWYHMHYSHGICYTTGKQLDKPHRMQWNIKSSAWEALCGGCHTWLALGGGKDRAKTTYFRHAYKCHVKDNPNLERPHSLRKCKSPRKVLGKSH